MRPLRDLMPGLVRQLDLEEAALADRAIRLWPVVVGEVVAGAAWPERVRGGTMFVVTASPAWSQELAFQKSELLRLYREQMGRPFVRDLRFRAGDLTELGPQADPARETVASPWHSLTPEEERRVEALITGAAPEAREAARRLLTADARRRKTLLASGGRECSACGAAFRGRGTRCDFCRLAPPRPSE